MSNLSLYNITNKFVELMDKAQEGELTEEEYNELGNELALELQNKSSNIIGYIKNSESLLEAMKTEEKRLSDIRKQGEKKLNKFYQYVKENMERLELVEIPTELGKLKITKNPMSIEIENEDEIPSEFKKEVITTQIDKTAIKNHFKDTGELVPGTRIIDNKTSLRIK
jgi:seryl-tRNA synthetase